jgi:uncharacterized cupredoxin-like copper-binding protein
MKVKLKSYEEIKEMVKKGEVNLIHSSDSGEVTHYATVGNPSHVMSVWFHDYDSEYEVVDHSQPISKDSYERLQIFFKN